MFCSSSATPIAQARRRYLVPWPGVTDQPFASDLSVQVGASYRAGLPLEAPSVKAMRLSGLIFSRRRRP
jgi:hypothetical protein